MTTMMAAVALSAAQRPAGPPEGAGIGAGGNARQRPSRVNRGGTARRRKDPRKVTIEHQGGFLVLMARKFAERAKGEDPGYGLRALMKIQAVVDQAVGEVGQDLYRQVGGQAMADDLTISTGEKWTRQRVFKRWGGGAK